LNVFLRLLKVKGRKQENILHEIRKEKDARQTWDQHAQTESNRRYGVRPTTRRTQELTDDRMTIPENSHNDDDNVYKESPYVAESWQVCFQYTTNCDENRPSKKCGTCLSDSNWGLSPPMFIVAPRSRI